MVYRGTIKGGGVVLPAGVSLPDGTEVLVALPNQGVGSESERAALRESTVFGRREGASPSEWPPDPAGHPQAGADGPSDEDGPVEEPHDYPVADFLSPLEYDWDEDIYAAEEAVRAYLNDSHAHH
jgi:hypothetical protein